MVNSNSSNLAADTKAGSVNYLMASSFQQVDVLLNGNLISSSTNTYIYRAMLEFLLGYDQEVKKSYLSMVCYGKDTATKMELMAVDGANGGLKARAQCVKERELAEMSGPLHCNLVSLDRLLLTGLPSKIVFHQQRERFVLMADDEAEIVEFTL